MNQRVRFKRPVKEAGGVCPRGMSFEEMMDALYRVLRKHPEAMADVEETFRGMANRQLGKDGLR